MRILIVQCFVALLGITYGAVELKPGFWNDKPWELADLEKRLAANDPEAFAEKAYWIADGWGGQVYDKKLMFQLAKKAAEGGSLIGETFLARCYMYGLGTKKDEAAAGKIIRKILPEGHPYTLNYYSNCLSDGSCGFSKDLEKGLKVRQDAIDKGCGMAFRNHLISVYEGVNGVAENKKKAVSMAAARLRAGGKNSECALIILRAFSWRVMAPELGDKKLIVMAEERARIAADLGHPAAMQNYAYYLGHAGRPNEAVPYMVRAAQIGDEDSLGRLVEMSIGGGTSRRNHSVGQYSTHYRLARLAWDAGNRFPSVTESAAESYLFKWSAEKPAPLKALPILEYDLQRGENVHGLLGKFYCEFDHAKHDAKRGEAHFVEAPERRGSSE